MRIVRHPLLLFLCIEIIGMALCVRELKRLHNGRLHAAFLDVGQGDSALITTPSGKRVIIDGGRDMTLLRKLGEHLPLTDRRIDLLVLSHPQLDHIAAFPELLRRYDVNRILLTGVRYDLPQYGEFLEEIRKRRIPLWIADPAQDVDFGDGVLIDVIWPPPVYFGRETQSVNNTSVMLRFLSRSGSILFTGDAEIAEESAALASGAPLNAGVLKVGHHGSKTSSGTGFLLAAHPNLAVISAAEKNSYGHPHRVILERLRALDIPVRVTGWEGTIEVEY